MLDIFKGAGVLIYPLGLCSLVAVYILCERLYALRKAAVLPDDLVEAVVRGTPYSGGSHSVLARVLGFASEYKTDPDAVKAFARLEINRLERGIPYLEVIYAAAQTLDEAKSFYSDVKGRLAKYGRAPDDLKVTPGLFYHLGRSRQEAQEKYESYREAVDLSGKKQFFGVDVSAYPLDGGNGRPRLLAGQQMRDKRLDHLVVKIDPGAPAVAFQHLLVGAHLRRQ